MRFEKGGTDPLPGLAATRDFGIQEGNEKETILTFPMDFVVTIEEMAKIPANAHLIDLEK